MRGLAANDLPNLFRRTDRHGALVDDHAVAGHRLRDLAGDAEHVPEVGGTVLTLRRADGDEHDLRRPHRLGQLGGERQPAFELVAFDQFLQARFVDRHLTAPQHPDLGLDVVHADHVVPRFRQTRTQHEADIACSDDRNLHPRILLSGELSGLHRKTQSVSSAGSAVNILNHKDLLSSVLPIMLLCDSADPGGLPRGPARTDRRR